MLVIRPLTGQDDTATPSHPLFSSNSQAKRNSGPKIDHHGIDSPYFALIAFTAADARMLWPAELG